MKYLSRKRIDGFLSGLSKGSGLIVPVKKDDGATLFMEYGKYPLFLEGRTDFSPKPFFLPEREEIAGFEKKANDDYLIKEKKDEKERVIFGIRPCDTNAIALMDEILLKYFFPERNYEARRKNSILIAIGCREPCGKESFCSSLGTNIPKGHDVLLTPLKEGFAVRAETEKGKELLGRKEIAEFLEDIGIVQAPQTFESKNKIESNGVAGLLKRNFESKVWKQEGERCLNCTSCTQVCPSCYCFCIKDELSLEEGKSKRIRCLDSCFLDRFSRISKEVVFRKSNGAKLRQFVCHNFYYSNEKHGVTKCVGCGRCIEVCPVKISITEVLKKIKADDKG